MVSLARARREAAASAGCIAPLLTPTMEAMAASESLPRYMGSGKAAAAAARALVAARPPLKQDAAASAAAAAVVLAMARQTAWDALASMGHAAAAVAAEAAAKLAAMAATGTPRYGGINNMKIILIVATLATLCHAARYVKINAQGNVTQAIVADAGHIAKRKDGPWDLSKYRPRIGAAIRTDASVAAEATALAAELAAYIISTSSKTK